MDYKENKIQCFLQTKYLRRCQQFGKFELARCCNSNAAQDKMSTSSYNRNEHRSCRCGERSGPAAEEQLVEDLETDSWPRLQKSSGKGHLELLAQGAVGPARPGAPREGWWVARDTTAWGCPPAPALCWRTCWRAAGEAGSPLLSNVYGRRWGRRGTFPFH